VPILDWSNCNGLSVGGHTPKALQKLRWTGFRKVARRLTCQPKWTTLPNGRIMHLRQYAAAHCNSDRIGLDVCGHLPFRDKSEDQTDD